MSETLRTAREDVTEAKAKGFYVLRACAVQEQEHDELSDPLTDSMPFGLAPFGNNATEVAAESLLDVSMPFGLAPFGNRRARRIGGEGRRKVSMPFGLAPFGNTQPDIQGLMEREGFLCPSGLRRSETHEHLDLLIH